MKKLLLGALLSTGLLVTACAQKAVEQKLDAKMAQETPAANNTDLLNKTEDLIEKSNLSADKKAKLSELRAATAKKSQELRDESMKLRGVLIKDVLSAKYNKAEVKLIQNKIKKVENQRVALIFDTVDKANGILGRETRAEEHEKIMEQMILNRDAQF